MGSSVTLICYKMKWILHKMGAFKGSGILELTGCGQTFSEGISSSVSERMREKWPGLINEVFPQRGCLRVWGPLTANAPFSFKRRPGDCSRAPLQALRLSEGAYCMSSGAQQPAPRPQNPSLVCLREADKFDSQSTLVYLTLREV